MPAAGNINEAVKTKICVKTDNRFIMLKGSPRNGSIVTSATTMTSAKTGSPIDNLYSVDCQNTSVKASFFIAERTKVSSKFRFKTALGEPILAASPKNRDNPVVDTTLG